MEAWTQYGGLVFLINIYHYRKLRLCLEFQDLPRAFYRALGKGAQHSSTHVTASFAEGRADGRPGPSA
jgi:hypothetical protein